MPSWAGLAEPSGAEADLRPGLQRPEGCCGRAAAVAGCSGTGPGAGQRGAGRSGTSGPRALFLGKVPSPAKGGRSKASPEAAGLVPIIMPGKVPFLGVDIRALWEPAPPTQPFFFFFSWLHSLLDNAAPRILVADLFFLWHFPG